MAKHAKLHELEDRRDDGSAVGDIPSLTNVIHDDQRLKHRRDLMLDDEVLQFASFDTRRYIGWKVALYWLLSLITAGTVSIVAYWPFCRRRKERWISATCQPESADFAIVEVSAGCASMLTRTGEIAARRLRW